MEDREDPRRLESTVDAVVGDREDLREASAQDSGVEDREDRDVLESTVDSAVEDRDDPRKASTPASTVAVGDALTNGSREPRSIEAWDPGGEGLSSRITDVSAVRVTSKPRQLDARVSPQRVRAAAEARREVRWREGSLQRPRGCFVPGPLPSAKDIDLSPRPDVRDENSVSLGEPMARHQITRAAASGIALRIEERNAARDAGEQVPSTASTVLKFVRDPGRPSSDDPAAMMDNDKAAVDQSQDAWRRSRMGDAWRGITGDRTFAELHREHCATCRAALAKGEEIHGFARACYAYDLYMKIAAGWRLSMPGGVPPARVLLNYDPVKEHPEAAAKAWCKQARAHAFSDGTNPPGAGGDRVSISFQQEPPPWVHPLNLIVRSRDVAEARRNGTHAKARATVDLKKNWNGYLGEKWAFGYAGFRGIIPHLKKDAFVGVADISSYYSWIPVHPTMSAMLGIEVPALSAAQRAEFGVPEPTWVPPGETEPRGPFCHFHGLPQGLRPACAIASVISAEVCRICMQRLPNSVFLSYIDDVIYVTATHELALRAEQVLREVLAEMGLALNEKKTAEGAPARRNTWLGIEINTETMEFTIPQERQQRHADEWRYLLSLPWVSGKVLKSALGMSSWMAIFMRGARLHLRSLYRVPRTKRKHVLTQEQRDHISWLIAKLEGDWAGSRWLAPGVTPVYLTKSDAGDDACGLVHGGRFLWHAFTEEEKLLSSHARELLPLVLAAEAFGAEWSGAIIAMIVDNSGTAVTTSKAASHDEGAQLMLARLAEVGERFGFDCVGLWGARASNVPCDAISKMRVMPTEEEIWLPYSSSEKAAATTEVGEGCWLRPRAYCATTQSVLGDIDLDGQY